MARLEKVEFTKDPLKKKGGTDGPGMPGNLSDEELTALAENPKSRRARMAVKNMRGNHGDMRATLKDIEKSLASDSVPPNF